MDRVPDRFAIVGIPVATGIAILRHRLYDIDVVINRTLVYGTLTAALAVTYVGSVLLMRLLLGPLAGDSALSVAGLDPGGRRTLPALPGAIQAVVDRRFYRSRYDAARTLDEFSQRLRHELDLDAVGADLCAPPTRPCTRPTSPSGSDHDRPACARRARLVPVRDVVRARRPHRLDGPRVEARG